MEAWALQHHLQIHPLQTTFIQFHPYQKNLNSTPLLKLNGQIIKSNETTETTKFLGLLRNESLNWTPHCNEVTSRIRSVIFLIRSLFGCVSPEILKLVYYAHVFSHIQYSILFWGMSPQAKHIFVLQKQAIRAMYGLRYNEHCSELFLHNKILTVPSIYITYLSAQCFLENFLNIFPWIILCIIILLEDVLMYI
jgi:hypothetical protein